MSKIGVGIGEDFPLDESAPRNTQPPGDGAPRSGDPQGSDGRDDYAEWAARRDAHRQWRAQRREWKRRWREEWRAHRRRFHDEFERSYRDGRGAERHAMVMGHPFFWDHHAAGRILAIVAVVAIVALALTHIYVILGLAVIGALVFAAWRHGFDPFDLPPHDHAHREPPPPRPNPPQEPPRDTAH